jgi:hypothetical protein
MGAPSTATAFTCPLKTCACKQTATGAWTGIAPTSTATEWAAGGGGEGGTGRLNGVPIVNTRTRPPRWHLPRWRPCPARPARQTPAGQRRRPSCCRPPRCPRLPHLRHRGPHPWPVKPPPPLRPRTLSPPRRRCPPFVARQLGGGGCPPRLRHPRPPRRRCRFRHLHRRRPPAWVPPAPCRV